MKLYFFFLGEFRSQECRSADECPFAASRLLLTSVIAII